MNQTKLNLVHQILKYRKYPVHKSVFQERLNCSESTVKRIIQALRNDYNAPLEYSHDRSGYYYSDKRFELNIPNVWGSPETLLALVSIQKLLAQMRLDVFDDNLNALNRELQQQLKRKNINTDQVNRIRILPITARISDSQHFQIIAGALLQRQVLKIKYHARGTDHISNRTISPQRLAHYKDNWYLDAWCHMRNQKRTFALDRIKEVEDSIEQCIDLSEVELDQYLASSYGIFSGEAKQSVILVFSDTRARWVADEIWHPKQIGFWLPDGRYQLEIPYSDERELLMDIMRHLPEVEVISPPELKQTLLQYLEQSLKRHEIVKK